MWSNWATPPSLPQKFNTLFFLATLPQMPVVHSDEREIQNLMVGFSNNKLIFMFSVCFYSGPPQNIALR